MPGDGPTWIDGLCVCATPARERMFAKYVKVRKLLEVYERGLVEWDDATRQFRKVVTFDFSAPLYPLGMPCPTRSTAAISLFWQSLPGGARARRAEALADPAQYEAFTRWPRSTSDKPAFDRDIAGGLRLGLEAPTRPPPAAREQAIGSARSSPGQEPCCAARRDSGEASRPMRGAST